MFLPVPVRDGANGAVRRSRNRFNIRYIGGQMTKEQILVVGLMLVVIFSITTQNIVGSVIGSVVTMALCAYGATRPGGTGIR